MFGDKFIARMMAGVAAGGAALLMTAPSASAFHPDFSKHGQLKKDDCFVSGTLTVPDFEIDVQITVSFDDLAAGVEAYVNLSCSTYRGGEATAIVFLDTAEGFLLVPLELVYPDAASAFDEVYTKRGHASKADPRRFDHKTKDGPHFVYEGTATATIATGADPFELEDQADALLAQDTVLVKANGTIGTLEVRGILFQGIIGAP